MRSSGFRPASVERKSVERRSAFEVTTLYAQTLVTVQVLEVKNAWSYCVELWSNSGMSLSVEGSPFCDFLKEGSGWPVL